MNTNDLEKRLRDIGAVGVRMEVAWVNAPLEVVLEQAVKAQAHQGLTCSWCDQPARGDAWHNDGKLHPSCGQVDHGGGWVPASGLEAT